MCVSMHNECITIFHHSCYLSTSINTEGWAQTNKSDRKHAEWELITKIK